MDVKRAIVMRPCLSRLPYLFLVILFAAFPTSKIVGIPLQREIPHFVDAAGAECVDLSFTLPALKRLRNETPRIARTPFSPDFEALYTLPSEGPAHSQTVTRMAGTGRHGRFIGNEPSLICV
jgi:hypothetical protein